jgi:hypothetical protein
MTPVASALDPRYRMVTLYDRLSFCCSDCCTHRGVTGVLDWPALPDGVITSGVLDGMAATHDAEWHGQKPAANDE